MVGSGSVHRHESIPIGSLKHTFRPHPVFDGIENSPVPSDALAIGRLLSSYAGFDSERQLRIETFFEPEYPVALDSFPVDFDKRIL